MTDKEIRDELARAKEELWFLRGSTDRDVDWLNALQQTFDVDIPDEVSDDPWDTADWLADVMLGANRGRTRP